MSPRFEPADPGSAAEQTGPLVGEVWGGRVLSLPSIRGDGGDDSAYSQFELWHGHTRRWQGMNTLAGMLAKAGAATFVDFYSPLKAINQIRCIPPLDDVEIRELAEKWSATSEERRFQRTDLTSVAGETPDLIVPGLVYRRWPTIVFGETGSGKSIFAAGLNLEAIRSGLSVGHWDEEMGANATLLRYSALGASDDEIRAIAYYGWSGPTLDDSDAFIDQVVRDNSDLVIIDPTADFLAAAGLEENANSEVTAWYASFPQRLTQEGIACIVVDGTPHGGGHARGASQKGYKAALVFSFDVVVEPRKDQVGEVALTCTKDRFGDVGRGTVHRFSLGGDGAGHIVFRRLGPTGSKPTATRDQVAAEQTRLWADNVVIVLRQHASGEAAAISQSQLLNLLPSGSRTDFKKSVIAHVASSPSYPIQAKPGPRGSTLYWHTPTPPNPNQPG